MTRDEVDAALSFDPFYEGTFVTTWRCPECGSRLAAIDLMFGEIECRDCGYLDLSHVRKERPL